MKFQGPARNRGIAALTALLTIGVSLSASADDIDVYTARLAAQQKPNVLFVLDYSGSMGWDLSGVTNSRNGESRLSVLKKAMTQILDENADKINAGLGSQFSTKPSGINWPITDLALDASIIDPDIPPNRFTAADIIKQQINAKEAGGWTATVDALVEAAQYFRGDPVTHNDTSVRNFRDHKPPTWNKRTNSYTGGGETASVRTSYTPSDAWTKKTRGKYFCNDYSMSGGPNYCEQKVAYNCKTRKSSDPATNGYELTNNLWGSYKRCRYNRYARWETPRYNSPINDVCEEQTNAIVLITDGDPTRITRGASLRSIVGNDLSACEDLTSLFASSYGTSNQANCGIEVVGALAKNTVNPYFTNTNVKTYPIGFKLRGPGQTFLNRLAAAGQGVAYDAQSPEDLTNALAAALLDIRSGSESFSELSVDVDKASFAHKDRVYYSLFSPSLRRSWQGNLKGYFVKSEGLKDINGQPAVKDGAFADSTQSFWSDEPDGDDVSAGGASEQLTTGTRTLYTYVGDTVPKNGVALSSDVKHRLRSSNRALTNNLLELSNNADGVAQRTLALDWLQNAPMGAPLHTKSVGVDYGDKQVMYVTTNQGLLHAIDASLPESDTLGDTTGGEELFAFMPKRLLKNLPLLNLNSAGGEHIYGLDGAITRFHDDTNNDGIVNNSESVMLYFGMRRGGSAYYAIDVSNYERPVLKWVIDNTTPGFEKLAQSWSRMSLINVSNNGNKQRALAFSGGYDAQAQDDQDAPIASSGNALFLVDEQGKLLWSVDNTNHENMVYSIASDLTVIDSDADQLADRIYVGDLGGQVWRVDFPDVSDEPIVTRFANLADDDHQPIFYPPSVSINGQAGKRFLAITVGSGNRTSPLLEGSSNHFYMMRDNDLKKGAPATSTSLITKSDLYNATDNLAQSPDVEIAAASRAAIDSARGWKVQLDENEKSLSAVLAYEGRIVATTFKADGSTAEYSCGFAPTGKYYVMNVLDATVEELPASTDDSMPGQSGNGNKNGPSRGKSLNTQGIPTTPVPVMIANSDNVQIFVDKTPIDEFTRRLSRVYWHAR